MKRLLCGGIVLIIFSCNEEPVCVTDFEECGWQPVSAGEIVKHKYNTLAYSE